LLNDDIKGYFRIYNPQKVEWINDSSCNVVFDSEETANQVYMNLTLSKNYDSRKILIGLKRENNLIKRLER